MRLIKIAIFLIIGCSGQAQSFESMMYDWEKDRKRMAVNKELQGEPAVMLFLNDMHENIYADQNKTRLEGLNTVHRVILVNADNAIDVHNKVYIYLGAGESLVDIKARTINASGAVVNFDKSKIKDLSEEENKNYKIFAIEGVEKGSEIEYLYKVKKQFSVFGREFFQFSIPVQKASFSLINPENLRFECKGYNGFPEVIDTVYNDRQYLSAEIINIPSLPEEHFSFASANKMRVEYKLAYNKANRSSRLYTWAEAAQTLFSRVNTFNSKENKLASKFYKKAEVKSGDGIDQKIHKIDRFIKRNIYISDEVPNTTLDVVIEKKYASEMAVMRLYANFFRQAGIEYEIVYTTDRRKIRFDDEFDTWNYLSKALFYFPQTKKYLCPTSYEFPYGLIPFEYTHNKGIFIKKVALGDVETGLHEIRFIDAPAYDASYDDMQVDISFTPELDKNIVKIKRSLGGYKAANVYGVLPFLKPEDKEKVLKDMITYMLPDAKFEEVRLVNRNIELPITDTSMVVTAKATGADLIEHAGKKLILKVGEIIGEQMEMYQDNKRKTDVENSFNRTYIRKIRLNIPDNYVVKNPEVLNMSVVCKDGDEDVFGFVSTYTQKGSVIEVDVQEYYKVIGFPLARYEEYRKVINAAADFNKIKLILEASK